MRQDQAARMLPKDLRAVARNTTRCNSPAVPDQSRSQQVPKLSLHDPRHHRHDARAGLRGISAASSRHDYRSTGDAEVMESELINISNLCKPVVCVENRDRRCRLALLVLVFKVLPGDQRDRKNQAGP